MIVYAESSALVAWLLAEARGAVALAALRDADRVFASELALVECDRTIRWGIATRRLDADGAEAARTRLDSELASWTLCALDAHVLERARSGFPREPVRALDALHLATALLIRDIRPGLRLLSFDRRIRENAVALGFDVLPAEF